MTTKNPYSRSFRKLLNLAVSVSVAVALSACTKAQLIGAKQLKSVKLFSVLSVSPPNGPIAGGTTVTLVGTGFVSGMTIKIGNITCGSVQVFSSLSATCVTGSSAVAGTDTISIVNGDGATDASHTYVYLGSLNATATRIASGGNINSTGGSGVNKVTARATTIAALVHKTGNTTTGGAGASKVTLRGGVVGVFSMH